MYGDVYLSDPLDGGKVCFFDHTTYEDFMARYAAPYYDKGRFLFVVSSK